MTENKEREKKNYKMDERALTCLRKEFLSYLFFTYTNQKRKKNGGLT